ncbi:hypothetical protein LARI1_G009462, partial [Lachnellula arida]
TNAENLESAPTTSDNADKIKWHNMLENKASPHQNRLRAAPIKAVPSSPPPLNPNLTGQSRSLHPAIPLALRPKIPPPSSTSYYTTSPHIKHEKNETCRVSRPNSREESEKIARSFMRTKYHPGALTSSPLAEGLAGLLAAPVDKLRTMMESFLDKETKSAEVDWRCLL